MDKNNHGYVGACILKRDEKSDWEYGFYINENIVLDLDGNRLEDIWDLKYVPANGCFHLYNDKLKAHILATN